MALEMSGGKNHPQALIIQQAPEQTTDDAAPALRLPLTATGSGLCAGRVVVGALKAYPAWAGEAIEDEVAGAAEEARLEAVHLLAHRDRVVVVEPAARFDVDRLARLEVLLEDVAVAVNPD